MVHINRVILVLLLLCLSLQLSVATPPFPADSLSKVLKTADQTYSGQNTANFIKEYIEGLTRPKTERAKNEITGWLSQSNIQNRFALIFFTEAICAKHIYHLAYAQALMLKAVESVNKADDRRLLYLFLKNLAFIQTDVGDAIGALSSYRLAKREATNLTDASLQVIINVDISDIYFKYNFFYQALSYLDEAEQIQRTYRPDDKYLKATILKYKCDVFFRMGKTDSLKKYNTLLKIQNAGGREYYSQLKRNDYYLCLLNGDFYKVIDLLKAARRDSIFQFYNGDRQSLAEAFLKTGQTDSATNIINDLLADTLEANHPELKHRQYEMLAQIAQQKGDHAHAAIYFQKALHQSAENIKRLVQVGSILSQFKSEEIEGAYLQKNQVYKKERIWLLFAVVVAILIIVIGGMFYRNAKQKRHYERLLFTAQKEELAFINSHEVRRHLSNILGIIDVLENSDDKENEYNELEGHLFASAENLDKAIKSFSEKLTD